ncbi:MAG: hypothetical protein K0U64_11665 [Actinomycetia bacterium]|nr:hypothetical protein [Actinomycetes bacterium]
MKQHRTHARPRTIGTSAEAELPLQWHSRTPSQRRERPHKNPQVAPLVGNLAGAIAEVYSGARPAQQLRSAVAPVALARLAASVPTGQRRLQPVRRVSSVRIRPAAAGTLEACAIVTTTERCHAVALQLRQVRSRWVATAVEIH